MSYDVGETNKLEVLPDMEGAPMAVPTGAREVCVGMRVFGEDTCLDPEVPRLSAEIGKCVTCDTCQMKLEMQATTDELTELGNRHALKVEFEKMLKGDAPVMVVFTDLRNFKPVNKRESYSEGDKMIAAAANRLNEIVRDADGIAKGRPGGDEAVILMQLFYWGEDVHGVLTERPATPDEVPQIMESIALRIISGFDDFEVFQTYNYKHKLEGAERLGIRVGTTAVYPDRLRSNGLTVELDELMEKADPRNNPFHWNDLD